MKITDQYTDPEQGSILKKIGLRQDTNACWIRILPHITWTFHICDGAQSDYFEKTEMVAAYSLPELYKVLSFPTTRYRSFQTDEDYPEQAIDRVFEFIINDIEQGNIHIPTANMRLGNPSKHPSISLYPQP